MAATLYSATFYEVGCRVCGDVGAWSDEEWDARNDPLSVGFVPRATALLLAWAHNQQWHQGEEVSEISWRFTPEAPVEGS